MTLKDLIFDKKKEWALLFGQNRKLHLTEDGGTETVEVLKYQLDFIEQAMTAAAKETLDAVVPEKRKDTCDGRHWECEAINYNQAIDDMQKRASEFLGEDK